MIGPTGASPLTLPLALAIQVAWQDTYSVIHYLGDPPSSMVGKNHPLTKQGPNIEQIHPEKIKDLQNRRFKDFRSLQIALTWSIF